MARNRLVSNFTGVSAFIFASKLLGFLRDVIIAASIGTTLLSDAYFQIFGVASLLFTSVGMALSSVNIPNMTYYVSQRSDEERFRYTNNLYTQVMLFAGAISILGIAAAPWVTRLILPGLEGEMGGIPVTLTRIMFPALPFICLTYITSGILQVHKHFIASTIISIPYNVLIIISLLILRGNIIILGAATTIGWLLQFLVQVPVLYRERYRFRLDIGLDNEHTSAVYRQLVPILLGNAVLQLCLLTGRAFATHLQEGSTAALALGSTLFMTITSIFIVAMSTVTFPGLSKHCLDRDYEGIRNLLNYIFKILLLILVPYLIIVTVYGRDIIRLVYERGSFTAQSTGMTSTAFLIYSFCIAGYLCQEVFNRLYYALKKYHIPMILSISCVLLNLAAVSLVYRSMGIAGIAGSTAASLLIYAVVMSFMVRKEVGGFLGKDFAVFLLRLCVPVMAMIVVFAGFRLIGFDGLIKGFILPLGLGGLAYLAAAHLTGILKETVFKRV
jgi:putative peptidoglycan lipid II flippase